MWNNEFCDVTLASADGQKIMAHKVILAASSSIFRNMLVNENHSHPLIFMRGVNQQVLVALMDFMYRGEAEIEKKLIDSFVSRSRSKTSL